MRKSLVLVVIMCVFGATQVGADPGTSDPSTWRWAVSNALAAQQGTGDRPIVTVGELDSRAFDQRHERYSTLGVLENDLRAKR